MNTGPPTTLMITAALISYGEAIVLPTVSASKKMKAPNTAEKGRRYLFVLPTKSLAMCGTSRPKKLTIPTIAVALEAKITAIKLMIIRR